MEKLVADFRRGRHGSARPRYGQESMRRDAERKFGPKRRKLGMTSVLVLERIV